MAVALFDRFIHIRYYVYSEEDLEKTLPQDTLFALCSMNAFQKYVCRADQAFYQALVEVLIPDVLRPIPSAYDTVTFCRIVCLQKTLNVCMHGLNSKAGTHFVGVFTAVVFV